MLYRVLFGMIPLLVVAMLVTGAFPVTGSSAPSGQVAPERATIVEQAQRDGVTPGTVMGQRVAEGMMSAAGVGPSASDIAKMEATVKKAEAEIERQAEQAKLRASGWAGGGPGSGWGR